MSDIQKNQGVLGILLLFLILGGRSGGLKSSGWSRMGGTYSMGNLADLGKKLQLENFARDMHRVVAMLDQVESLTRVAGIGQLAAAAGSTLPASNSSGSHITGAANSVSGAFSDVLSSLNGQDLSQLMEMAGPIISMLNGQHNSK